jgi:DNA-binding transcriptional ArsR family regulator
VLLPSTAAPGAALLRALAEPRRQQILRLVLDRELAAGEIHRAIAAVSFGAISQHLRILEQAGAVQVRRDGRRRLYRARRGPLRPFRRTLETLWADALSDLKSLAEAESEAEAEAAPRSTR